MRQKSPSCCSRSCDVDLNLKDICQQGTGSSYEGALSNLTFQPMVVKKEQSFLLISKGLSLPSLEGSPLPGRVPPPSFLTECPVVICGETKGRGWGTLSVSLILEEGFRVRSWRGSLCLGPMVPRDKICVHLNKRISVLLWGKKKQPVHYTSKHSLRHSWV